MTKELRANVIFVLILLVLILPGFVILMRKKLAGPTDPAHIPPMVPHQAAYIQPPPIPPRVPRIEPPEVRAWVTRQLHDRIDPNASVARDITGAGPIVGDRFVSQLVHASDEQIALLIWSSGVTQASIALDSGDGPQLLAAAIATRVDVPKRVRHALQQVGYVNPPEEIAWVAIPLDGRLPSGTRLRITYGTTTESLTLP